MADNSPPPTPPPYDDWEFIAADYGVVILDDCLFSDDNAVVILDDYIFSDDNGDQEKQSEIEKADDEEEEEEEEDVEHDVTSLIAGLPRPLILNRGDLNDGELYDEEEDDDVDYETDDMDDELVPQGSKGRLAKDRIRKIGKRGGPRVSKRVPYYHNRPGCLRGKHGFGVQQTFYI